MITINSKMDEMFGAKDDVSQNVVTYIATKKIHLREDHPFYINEEKLAQLKDSIKEHDILTPLVVREIDGNYGHYELLAGHHRLEACKSLGTTIVPCIIKNVDDDTAVQIMIESNKQRGFSDMKPSEIAFALKMEHDILKRQGKRNDLISEDTSENTSAQIEQKSTSEKSLSPANIRRYIRLTNLILPLLDLLDNSKIKFIVGVEMSFLNVKDQHILYEYITAHKSKIDIRTAKLIRELSSNESLNNTILLGVFAPKEKHAEQKQQDNISIDVSLLKEYIEDETDVTDYEEYILQALKFYKSHIID